MLYRYRVSVLQDQKKRALNVDGGDGCTTVRMYLKPTNCTFDNG